MKVRWKSNKYVDTIRESIHALVLPRHLFRFFTKQFLRKLHVSFVSFSLLQTLSMVAVITDSCSNPQVTWQMLCQGAWHEKRGREEVEV